MLWRFQVQADDVGGLRLKIRIVGGHVSLKAVRLQTMFGPDSGNRHMGNAATQRLGELARRPLRRAVGRFVLGRPSENTGFQRFGQLVSATSLVPSKQPGQTLAFKAPTPPANEAVAAVQLAANLRTCVAFSQKQNQARPTRAIDAPTPRAHLPLQLRYFALRQFHLTLHRGDNTI
ncbi:MAG: hypothetical protein M0Q15_10020 [Nevskia sp.]|nr:hypothetical protein [Nevskia sp.]